MIQFKDYEAIFIDMLKDLKKYGFISEDITVEEFISNIRDRKNINNFFITDKSILATVLSEFYIKLEEVYHSHQIQKALLDDLDNLGELTGVSRYPATYAEVIVSMELSSPAVEDIFIPEGLVFLTTDEKLMFTSISGLYINKGNTKGEVVCKSNVAGVNGRIGSGMVTKLVSTTTNSFKEITNPASSKGGYDAETDNQYRDRIINLAKK